MGYPLSLDTILLVAMLSAALWTVIGRSLLRSAIGLAVTSAASAILMYRLASPLAAVFELSVCAGLITVVFISTISLTPPLTKSAIPEIAKARYKRFGYLPLIIIIASIALGMSTIKPDFTAAIGAAGIGVRQVLWNIRQLDLFGQIIILVIGALGVVILFEEKKKDEW